MRAHIFVVALCGLFSAGVSFAQTYESKQADALVAAAMERTQHLVLYDGRYRSIAYPDGDVPNNIGVCTDLVVRAYRQLGIDLQQSVAPQRFASDLLAAPASLDVGGVQKVDASVDGAIDDGLRVGRLGAAPKHHAAEAQLADLHPGSP